eukprot:2905825-Ditylum_brightwellii.AAC.1
MLHGVKKNGKDNNKVLEITYDIPANHPTGLYWYHSHVHGSTNLQLMGGLVGAILVVPNEHEEHTRFDKWRRNVKESSTVQNNDNDEKESELKRNLNHDDDEDDKIIQHANDQDNEWRNLKNDNIIIQEEQVLIMNGINFCCGASRNLFKSSASSGSTLPINLQIHDDNGALVVVVEEGGGGNDPGDAIETTSFTVVNGQVNPTQYITRGKWYKYNM